MIQYLRHNEIDKSKWDHCISLSSQGLVYAYSWFLDIVSPDWEALIEDDYSSVFPLTHRRKAGINYLYQPYFTQQLGLFCRDNNYSEKKLSDFISAIPEKFRLIEIQLNVSNKANAIDNFKLTERKTHHLDLSGSYETICKNYSENLRRNIKKSEKSELKVSLEISPEDLISLFRKNRGSSIENLKPEDYQTLLLLTKSAKTRNVLECRGIINASNDLIAGALFLKSQHSYIFIFSAVNEEAREKGAMSVIIDSFIKDHSNENKYLDFEGSMDINLARFYKSFGSTEVVYLQLRKNNLPLFIRWLK